MQKLLLVDACIREEESRTLRLCNAFIKEFLIYKPSFAVEKVKLAGLGLLPFNYKMLRDRDTLIEKQQFEGPEFELAKQFAAADKILIGAPYWDLSFPAVLKLYVEHITAYGITFKYEFGKGQGLCKADKMAYVTTSGGGLKGINFGYEYFVGQCGQFGIKNGCQLICAENLDLEESDAEQIMSDLIKKLPVIVKDF